MPDDTPEYQWEVFISVRRRSVFSDWIEEHLFQNLQNFLAEDLAAFCARECKIFYFRDTLRPGDVWPSKLVDAIKTSRVGLALCSPSYFQSEWCTREFLSFYNRNLLAKCEVLVPISIHDGDNFPKWATSELQFGSLHEYVNTGPGFRETKKYSEFQDKVKSLSALLAERIRNAPPFQTWEIATSPPELTAQKIQQVRL